jgi:hypothetical protein
MPDTATWAVIIAALALLLSQLPPINILLKRAKLDMERYSRIHITHKVGNPNLQLHMILSNVGGKTIKIKGITSAIKRDGNQIAVLPAQNYLNNPTDKMTLLFTRILLKPKEEWANIVNFLNYFSRSDEKKYRDGELKLKAEIFEKRKDPQNKDKLVEADAQYVAVFIAMHDEKFMWLPGEYEIQVDVDTEPKRAKIVKSYRFTLFESDSEELSKFKDDYKYGDAIYWLSDKHPGVIVQLREA